MQAPDEDLVVKISDHRSSLEQTFLGYDDPGLNQATTECSKNRIEFKDLVSLVDEDLELLGIKYDTTRKQMLQDFANFPAPRESLDKFMQNLNPAEYSRSVCENIRDHLRNLRKVAAAARLKLDMAPVGDVKLVEDGQWGSEITMKVLCEMIQNIDEMTKRIGPQKVVKEKRLKLPILWLCLSSAFIATVFLWIRRLRK